MFEQARPRADSGVVGVLTEQQAKILYHTTIIPRLKVELETLIQDIYSNLQRNIPNMPCSLQQHLKEEFQPLRLIVNFSQLYGAYLQGTDLIESYEKINNPNTQQVISIARQNNQQGVIGVSEVYYFCNSIIALSKIISSLDSAIKSVEQAIASAPETIIDKRVNLQRSAALACRPGITKQDKEILQYRRQQHQLAKQQIDASKKHLASLRKLSPFEAEKNDAIAAYEQYLYPSVLAMDELLKEYQENRERFRKAKKDLNQQLKEIKDLMVLSDARRENDLQAIAIDIDRNSKLADYVIGKNISPWTARFNKHSREQKQKADEVKIKIENLEAQRRKIVADYPLQYKASKKEFFDLQKLYGKISTKEEEVLAVYENRIGILSNNYQGEKKIAMSDPRLQVFSGQDAYSEARCRYDHDCDDRIQSNFKLWKTNKHLEKLVSQRNLLQNALANADKKLHESLQFTDDDFSRLLASHEFMAQVSFFHLKKDMETLSNMKFQNTEIGKLYKRQYDEIDGLLSQHDRGILEH